MTQARLFNLIVLLELLCSDFESRASVSYRQLKSENWLDSGFRSRIHIYCSHMACRIYHGAVQLELYTPVRYFLLMGFIFAFCCC